MVVMKSFLDVGQGACDAHLAVVKIPEDWDLQVNYLQRRHSQIIVF